MTVIEAATRVRDGMVGEDYPWHESPGLVAPTDVRSIISEATAFDQGDEFESEAEVRAYFTVAERASMFGGDAITDQAVLDAMADAVIEHRWHCAFDEDL